MSLPIRFAFFTSALAARATYGMGLALSLPQIDKFQVTYNYIRIIWVQEQMFAD